MKSNVYVMLENFFNKDIIQMAKDLNYDEDNILILKNDIVNLQKKYPDTYNGLMTCNHYRDSRSPIEYAQDLVCSWIFEDYLLEALQKGGINIELNGADKKRKLLSASKISSSSDYVFDYSGKKVFIELANDYRGYWKENDKCDLRDSKFLHLKKMAENNDFSLLLGIDFVNQKFFILDVNSPSLDVQHSDFHWAFKKPAYTINLEKIEYYDFEISLLVDTIKSMVE